MDGQTDRQRGIAPYICFLQQKITTLTFNKQSASVIPYL